MEIEWILIIHNYCSMDILWISGAIANFIVWISHFFLSDCMGESHAINGTSFPQSSTIPNKHTTSYFSTLANTLVSGVDT